MASMLFLRVAGLCGLLALSFPGILRAESGYLTNGSEFPIAGSLGGDQTHPGLGLSPYGGFVVWEDNAAYAYHNGLGIRAQALDLNLARVGPVFRVNRTGGPDQNHELPKVVLFQGGGGAFVWQGGIQGFLNIYARFLSSSNTWLGNDVMVNALPNAARNPVVTTLPNGNVVVAWGSFNQRAANSMQDVYAQVLTPSGLKLGSELAVNEFGNFNQRNPGVAGLADGRFVVTWVSEQQRFENSVDIYARIFNADLSPSGTEFLVNTATNPCANPVVAATPGGGFVIAWGEKDLVVSTNSWDVFARPFFGPGTTGIVQLVNSTTFGDQYLPAITALPTGYLLTWTSLEQDGSREGVFARFLNATGGVEGVEFRVNTTTANSQVSAVPVSDGYGRALTVWSGFAGPVGGFDLFAQLYRNPSVPTAPPGNSLFGAPPPESFPDDVPIVVPTNGVTGGPLRDPPTNSSSGTAGVYTGLFYDRTNLASASSGYFVAKVTSKGAFSAKISSGGRNYSLSGMMDSNHQVKSTTKGKVSLPVEFTALGDVLTGRISGAGWSAPLLADRLVYSKSGAPAPSRGSYTIIIPPDTRTVLGPGGDGFGSVKVDGGGVIQLSGVLADGTKMTQSSALSRQGYWPLYVSLYRGGGQMLGWIQFTNQSVGGDLGGETIWMRPAGVASAGMKSYQSGFTNDVASIGSTYTRPASGRRVLDLRSADLIFAGGGLDGFLTNSVRLELNNHLTSLDGHKLNFSLNAASGLFKGSAVLPGIARALPFQGAVFQDTNIALGSFWNAGLGGQVYIGPQPAVISTNSNSEVNP